MVALPLLLLPPLHAAAAAADGGAGVGAPSPPPRWSAAPPLSAVSPVVGRTSSYDDGTTLHTPRGLLAPLSAALFDVRTFGAVGDGVTDDARAIQSAINASQAEHRALWFPGGLYVVNTTLVVACTTGQAHTSWPVRLFGEGMRQAVIQAGKPMRAVLAFASVARGFDKQPRGMTTDGHRIEGLGFDANFVADFAVTAPAITRSAFVDARFTAARLAGLFLGGWINTISQCVVSGNGLVGLQLANAVNAINVVNNIIEGNRNIGIFANSGTVVRIEGNCLESTGGPAIVANSVDALTIRSNYFEGNNHLVNVTFQGMPIGPRSRFVAPDGGTVHLCTDIVLSGSPWQNFLPQAPLNLSVERPCHSVTIESNYHNVIISRCLFGTYSGVWAAAVNALAVTSSVCACSWAPEPGPKNCRAVGGPSATAATILRNTGWTENSTTPG